MADVSVRPAVLADAAELGRIQVETWRLAYASILPASVLDGLTAGDAAEAWRAAISQPPSARHRVLVALEGAQTVGFVALTPEDSTVVQVGPLLVEARWGRRGHGSRLLAASVDTVRPDGVTTAVAWLLEADDVSRKFFASAGWAADGYARVLDTGTNQLREVRIHTALESPAV